jgi:DNA polymerase III subunit epsilon
MLSFDLSLPWREMSLAVVDVETTGFDANECRVIEVGIVRFERGQIAERWGQLIDPGCEIPAKITEITGITQDMVKGQPSFRELKWDIYGRLRDRLLVAYNAPFDWGFLEAEMTRAGLTMPELPVLDPLVWARHLMPKERSHRLGLVAEKLGIDLSQAHRAEHDAEATGKVLLRFADKVPVELGTLLAEQKSWQEIQEAAFAERRAARAAKRPAPAARTETQGPDTSQAALFG